MDALASPAKVELSASETLETSEATEAKNGFFDGIVVWMGERCDE